MNPMIQLAAVLLLAAAFTHDAAAQTLTVGSGEVRRGASISVPVSFTAGSTAVVGYELHVLYDAAVLGHPTCRSAAGAQCVVDTTRQRVTLLNLDLSLRPLPSHVAAELGFSAVPGARGTRALLGVYGPFMADAVGRSVPPTLHTGQILIR